ncbi:amino acid ABC transporter permease [Brucella lupini]|uniref:Amino ABC transporter, permease, 3-TM region, His/Glu/Gln/Arg/opine family domain protein n=1 Tax=Brucella lupini TaxID=255457 RepID=A0A256GFV7_9HYPH|nr:amino acid ABC transporter permease [Brucella lupini]OYR26003.1 amino ABC transporter, permease, 3-TM region, His/Glu/Gln/Arg/opine family domain protein [Brucella lupini]PZP66628.1 MAG: amino acid ABC transporter permease [Delftia acidovorans]
MNYSWNWSVLISDPYLQWLGWGALMTIVISLVSLAIALTIGTVVGVLHSTGNSRIRLFTSIYISLFRNIPLLLQMFLWFFVVPELLPDAIGTWLKRDLPHSEVVTAILALGLFTASRIAVQVSAGILALPPGQRMASKAAGFSTAQAYRFVLLPQAFRLIVPPLTSEFLTIFKNSSIAMTIGVFELTAQTQQIESFTYQGFETFTAATVIYISIALIVTMLMRQVERRTAIPGTI